MAYVASEGFGVGFFLVVGVATNSQPLRLEGVRFLVDNILAAIKGSSSLVPLIGVVKSLLLSIRRSSTTFDIITRRLGVSVKQKIKEFD